MAENRKSTGVISTDVELTLEGEALSWGKWDSSPISTVKAGNDRHAFVAKGRANTATGNEGVVKYKSYDGVIFTLYFNNPYSKQNEATIAASGDKSHLYEFCVNFPKEGHDIEFKYTIEKK